MARLGRIDPESREQWGSGVVVRMVTMGLGVRAHVEGAEALVGGHEHVAAVTGGVEAQVALGGQFGEHLGLVSRVEVTGAENHDAAVVADGQPRLGVAGFGDIGGGGRGGHGRSAGRVPRGALGTIGGDVVIGRAGGEEERGGGECADRNLVVEHGLH